jgi:hemerythrin-like metal-binding protein
MALKGWDNSFSVNHTTMDADHKQLVQMIGTLHEAMKAGQSKTVLELLVTKLSDYAQTHFSREEKYLTEKKHPDVDTQIQQHKVFLDKVAEFKRNFERGQMVVAATMLPFINEWFLNHVMKVDMKYK